MRFEIKNNFKTKVFIRMIHIKMKILQKINVKKQKSH